MNFEDEEYRRLYVRKTVTYKRIGWEGRAVMHEMLYEFDRAGAFELSGVDPVEAVELVTGLPNEVVQAGLSRLLKTPEPTWAVEDGRLVWSTFTEAQYCKRSDKSRKREARHRPSVDVTRGHTASDPVPQYNALQCNAEQRGSLSGSGSEPDPPPKPVQRIFDHWKTRLGHPRARLDGKRKRLIASRLKDHAVEDLLQVIEGVAKSDFHMGRDPKTAGKRHDGIPLIFRDADQIEKFIEIAEGKQSGRSSSNPTRSTGSHQNNHGLTGLESHGITEKDL